MAERRNKTVRDLVISVAVLMAAVFAFVGLYGGFKFAPGGPTPGQTPTADVLTGFQRAGENLPFSPAVPAKVPADWHPNSFDVTLTSDLTAGQLPTVRGGWITASGFVTLIEAQGSVAQVLTAELGTAGAARGTESAGGAAWTVVSGRRAEAGWYRELTSAQGRPVVYLITGSADPAAFRAVAESIAS